jgi:hypothetical protein
MKNLKSSAKNLSGITEGAFAECVYFNKIKTSA